jgi:hypothetical protein
MADDIQGGLGQVSAQPAVDTSTPEVATPAAPAIPAYNPQAELAKTRLEMNRQLQLLESSLDARSQSPINEKLLALAQGFLAPTKTGSFGESAGAAAGNYLTATKSEREQKLLDAKLKMELLSQKMTLNQKDIDAAYLNSLQTTPDQTQGTFRITPKMILEAEKSGASKEVVQSLKDAWEVQKGDIKEVPGVGLININEPDKVIVAAKPEASNIKKLENELNAVQQKLNEDPKNADLIREKKDILDTINKTSRLKDQIINVPPPSSSDVDFYASMALSGDYSWKVALSRSPGGKALIDAVTKRMPSLASERGLDYSDVASAGAERKALTSSLTDRTKYVATATQFINGFNKQADLVDKYAGSGVGGLNPVLNRWVQAGRKQILGDSEVNQLDTAIRGLAREHQRIVTGVTSNAQLHASAQETADQLLNKDMTLDQIKKTLVVMREEANNALDSGKGEVADLKMQLRGVGRGTPPSAETKTQEPLPKGLPEGSVKVGKSADGKHDVYQAPNGKKYIAD